MSFPGDIPDDSAKAEVIVDRCAVVLKICSGVPGSRLGQELCAGDDVHAHVHPDDRDLFDLVLGAAPERLGREATIALRWAGNNGRWSRVLASFDAADAHTIRLCLQRDDVTAARRSEEQMHLVVEGSAQGIVVRTRGEVLYMNESFAKLLGYASRRECIDSQPYIDSVIHPDDVALVLKHLQARVTGKEAVSHYEFRLRRRDSSIIWVETHAAMVSWNGESASLSWLTDISERKAMEAELIKRKDEAELASRTKTDFLANMSHELRTPLNAILGFSETMARKLFGPLDARYVGYAEDIHTSGRHLLELVNDVLDLSKLRAGKADLHECEIDLPSLVDEGLKLVRGRADAGNVHLKSSVAAGLPALCADQRAVKQILLNFLSNAVKFTPPEGEVTVAAWCDAEGRLCLSVADTGIGMSEAEVEVALSPFGQVDSKLTHRYEGTGLGLPICKSLMQLHEGELVVASEPGSGTTLTARFPAGRTLARRDIASL